MSDDELIDEVVRSEMCVITNEKLKAYIVLHDVYARAQV